MASPATVSRAGMIFLDVDEMGWQPFVNSWLQQRYKPMQNIGEQNSLGWGLRYRVPSRP